MRPTQDEVTRCLLYVPETGEFFWKSGNGRNRMSGKKAGGVSKGALYISFKGKRHGAHRLAFLCMLGRWPAEVDHKNLNPMDNRWDNLREATHAENNRNKPLSSTNKTGLKGVARCHHKTKPFRAWIKVNGKSIHLGYFKDSLLAHQAYRAAAQKHHAAFANYG